MRMNPERVFFLNRPVLLVMTAVLCVGVATAMWFMLSARRQPE
ncbi:hypothetical protein R0135_01210 [Congregibacter variabilis]|uniref:Uncharacterized protein n=1 Tax=Congregibacter variabilis TaxID=3081200 RepID=A0ABZ0I456_9GAMM|nr:hypothetical protein R0135_01210 [Congregibacter sp. IMCC43200]